MNQRRPSSSLQFKDSWWVWVALAFTLLKLWLTRAQTVRAITAAVHDDRLFVELAASLLRGEWLGPYTEFTLAKGPFYSIWIAAAHLTGLPLGLTQQMAYAGACALLILALGRLLGAPSAKLVAYLLLLWNPASFDGPTLTRLLRQNIYNPLGLAIFAGLIALYVRRERTFRQNLPWALLLGLSFGCFWLTREESIWIVPSVLMLAAALFFGLPFTWNAWRRPASLLVVSLLAGYLPIFTVSWLNYHYYNWFGTVEFRAPEFMDAYGALQRIQVGPVIPGVPITRQAREAAYPVSPMFAQLRPKLEGELGRRWAGGPTNPASAERQIGGGWFMWALRESVHSAGFAPDARSALDFYRYMADEINVAADQGRIPAGPHTSGFFPKWNPVFTAKLKPDFLYYADYFVTFSSATARNGPSDGDQDGFRFFRDITGDRLSPEPGQPDPITTKQHHFDDWKISVLENIGTHLRHVIVVLVALCHLVWLVRLGQAIRQKKFSYLLWLATAAWGGAVAYFAINLLIHVTSFPNIAPSAMASGYPLLILFAVVTLADAAVAWNSSLDTPRNLMAEPWIWAGLAGALIFLESPIRNVSLIDAGLHSILGALVTYVSRSVLGFLPALASVTLLLAGFILSPSGFSSSISLLGLIGGVCLVWGTFCQPARSFGRLAGLALGLLGLVASPESWCLPFAAGLTILWISARGTWLRLVPLAIGLAGLIIFAAGTSSSRPTVVFIPALIQTGEFILRWPTDWSAAGVLFYLPLALHALLLRRRKDAAPFDLAVCSLGLATLLHAAAFAWKNPGATAPIGGAQTTWLALGLLSSGIALVRLIQIAANKYCALVWTCALLWSTYVFYAFRDFARIDSPLRDHFPCVAALAILAFFGGLFLSRQQLRRSDIPSFVVVSDPLRIGFLALPGLIAIFLLLNWGQPLEDNQTARWAGIFSPRSAESGLKFSFVTQGSLSTSRIVGAADVMPVPVRNHFRGTRPDGDAFTGTIRSDSFKIDASSLVLPIAGYPVSEGNSLRLQIENATGQTVATIPFTGPNPGAHVAFWQIDTRAYATQFARLFLVDGRTSTQGWLAAASPIRTGDPMRATTLQRQFDWSFFTGALPALRWIVILSGLSFFLMVGLAGLRWTQRHRHHSL